ncbi:hypothetical protein SAMN05444158_3492 [Bradyrhizobium canariense]|uniref:Uncharacterized protein n=1 Tax=Bradyrhizobium canariense TaxID=255045 RepID=A0A1H1VNG2_9BRAD|nr:hypothetical protein SAMN05444158_3492 [Bradyrhizobium canariense]
MGEAGGGEGVAGYFVARMSEAISGNFGESPGYRFAHPGYRTTRRPLAHGRKQQFHTRRTAGTPLGYGYRVERPPCLDFSRPGAMFRATFGKSERSHA